MPLPKASVASRLASLAAILYAVLAAFHTIADFDVWWQLASGRWMATHHAILRQDVFSFTGVGTPWMYPPGSGLLFYWIWQLGGANLLSLLAPAAALIVALILVRRGGVLRAWTLVLAVPAIVWRLAVRADLFSTVLTAVFLAVLWEDHVRPNEKSRRWLWALPVLMLAWVNLHPGFILGLAATLAFAVRHPKRNSAIAAATVAATFVNPFGWRLYHWLGSLLNQLPVPAFLHSGDAPAVGRASGFIGEFAPTAFSAAIIGDAFTHFQDPDSMLWWLAALALVAVIIGVMRRHPWGALMLVASAGGAMAFSRFQAVFAICAVVVIPDLLAGDDNKSPATRWPKAAAAALIVLVALRGLDLSSNRYYFTHADLASFGRGVSGWFPARAVKFMDAHALPREVYNGYNEGGYLTWAAPARPVFIDGRGDPYSDDFFFQTQRMGVEAPTSADWQQAIERWKIRTLLVSVSRFGGFSGLPLKTFCDSAQFQLAYLDDTAAVFATPSAMQESHLTALDCRTAVLIPPPESAPVWDRFQFYANAGKIFYALERDGEADQAWTQARALFDSESSLHLDIGQLRHAQGKVDEAEREFRLAIKLRPTSTAYYALGDLMVGQRRPFEAMEYFQESALRDARPYEAWAAMGRSALEAQRPADALVAANRALSTSPYQGANAVRGRSFIARTLALRATALIALRQAPAAIESLEPAIRMTSDPRMLVALHLTLCEAYRAAGRLGDARRELETSKKMGATGAAIEQMEKELGPVGK